MSLVHILAISSMLHSCSTNVHWKIASSCLITQSNLNQCLPFYFLYSQIIIDFHKLYLFSSHSLPNIFPLLSTYLHTFYCFLLSPIPRAIIELDALINVLNDVSIKFRFNIKDMIKSEQSNFFY